MRITSLKCPECGADVMVREGHKIMYCSSCGRKLHVEDENTHTFNVVNEAEMYRAKTERMKFEAEMKEKEELKKERQAQQRKEEEERRERQRIEKEERRERQRIGEEKARRKEEERKRQERAEAEARRIEYRNKKIKIGLIIFALFCLTIFNLILNYKYDFGSLMIFVVILEVLIFALVGNIIYYIWDNYLQYW